MDRSMVMKKKLYTKITLKSMHICFGRNKCFCLSVQCLLKSTIQKMDIDQLSTKLAIYIVCVFVCVRMSVRDVQAFKCLVINQAKKNHYFLRKKLLKYKEK